MAQLNYEDFTKMTARPAKSESGDGSVAPRIRWFYLTEDGDTAIVRFNIKDIEDVKVISKHRVMCGNKARNISCLRTSPNDPIEKCPLCAAGERVTYRILLQLLVYEPNEEGVIEARPVIWEQAPKLRETLKSFAMEYQDLRNQLFKIIRHGKKGDTNTNYTIIPANANMYKADVYKPDFSGFDSYDSNYFVNNRTAEDMEYYLANGDFTNPYLKKEDEDDDKPAPVRAQPQPAARAPLQDIPAEEPVKEEQPARPTGPRRYTY